MKLFIKRLLTRSFWLLPIDNKKIFFSSYEGKQYSCNPKAIYKSILRSKKDYKYIWEYNSDQIPDELISTAKIVKHNSLEYFINLLTSKYIITNSGISASISLRRNQICINTWHGGGNYKKVGAVISEKVNGTSYKELKIIANHTTYFLSSSDEFTKIMIPSTLIPQEKFLNVGMPRNDIFFRQEKLIEAKRKVCKYFGISEKKNIVLFAPTYRGNCGEDEYMTIIPNIKKLISALNTRFGGEWIVLYRSHYFKSVNEKFDGVLDASNYPDMQDILCFCDVLITDYSSSIWDFSLTYRPCFLFVPDLKDYISERGEFYSDINTWPGIVANNDYELKKEIEEFDSDKYVQKVKKYHELMKNYDKGNACQAVLDILNL